MKQVIYQTLGGVAAFKGMKQNIIEKGTYKLNYMEIIKYLYPNKLNYNEQEICLQRYFHHQDK